MAREIWKKIPSLPQFEASSLGRIRMIPYRGPMPSGGSRMYGGTPRCGCWMQITKATGRFIFVHRRKTYKVHRLVCEAFNGPPPFKGAVVMHLDENSRNNKPSNLKWGTQKENLNAPGFLRYCRGRVGADNPYIKGRAKP